MSELINAKLLDALKDEYLMNWNGIHGFSHWNRVRKFGLRLAKENGANKKVVEYFAFFHDNQRKNEGYDPDHGRRASNIIRTKFRDMLDLNPEEIDLLCEACDGHNDGYTDADITVQTCWDSDRLDLMRVGIKPDPEQLCTSEAKRGDVIAWAVEQTRQWLNENEEYFYKSNSRIVEEDNFIDRQDAGS